MNSKFCITVLLSIVAVGSSFVVTAETEKKASRPSAGYVEIAGSQKGRIALVNSQSRVPAKDLEVAADIIAKHTKCKAEVADGKDAQLVIEIIDRQGEPALTVYPEDHKATVNVNGLAKGLSGEAVAKFLVPRCRKEVLRAFCYACGAGGSQFPNNILAISRISDLDLVGEFIPGDTANACQKQLKKIGITPKQVVSYLAACRLGCAPCPTNEVQKAVWDKVHSIPEKPIKITFDKDKQKPIVK